MSFELLVNPYDFDMIVFHTRTHEYVIHKPIPIVGSCVYDERERRRTEKTSYISLNMKKKKPS